MKMFLKIKIMIIMKMEKMIHKIKQVKSLKKKLLIKVRM